jgi:hypothetical protein
MNQHDLRVAKPVAEDIETAANIQELSECLSALLPAPGRVSDLNVHCGGGAAGRVICLIEVADIQAGDAARALGGVPFAFKSVVLELTPGPEFACRKGRPDQHRDGSCTCGTGQTVSITQIDL